jgi:hypothetical protein
MITDYSHVTLDRTIQQCFSLSSYSDFPHWDILLGVEVCSGIHSRHFIMHMWTYLIL